jgi:uncharacterized membrane protein YsdA (DUF1294 family)
MYWSDKRRAQHGQRRIRERTLHVLELLGGWPGAILARRVFRHKTRDWAFLAVSWVIIAVHVGAWIALWHWRQV